jgi:hypothetical protein
MAEHKKHRSTHGVTAAAKTLGALGGAVGGPARADVLSAERRREIAKMGAEARTRAQERKGHDKAHTKR